jgi:hypothetical protein
MDRVRVVHAEKDELEQVKTYLQQNSFTDPAPLHQLYKSTFNLVDLLDGYWYDVEEHHRNYSWKSKMLLSIMRFFMVNVWAYHLQRDDTEWMDFRKSLATEILK